jgi:hypothetical protein
MVPSNLAGGTGGTFVDEVIQYNERQRQSDHKAASCRLSGRHKPTHSNPPKEKGLTGAAANPSSSFSFFGGAEGARTPDLMTASHALSQLSYSPENEAQPNKIVFSCQRNF